MAAPIQDIILLFGDSLTQKGWEHAGLAQRLAGSLHISRVNLALKDHLAAYVRKFDVIDRGLSGYQTNWAIPVFEQILAQQHERRSTSKVQLLTIWYGANDAATLPSTQHVPRDRFKANLVHLVNMIRSPTSAYYSPDTRIILITPPPVNTHQWNRARNFEMTKSYAETVKEVGEQISVPVSDVWTEVWEAAGRDEKACAQFLYDGLHLNTAGYEIVFNSIMKIVEEKYPEIHYDKVKMGFIPWDEINTKDGPAILSGCRMRNAIA